jgi:hypothetical protein
MEVSIFLGIISREYALLYCWILTKKNETGQNTGSRRCAETCGTGQARTRAGMDQAMKATIEAGPCEN